MQTVLDDGQTWFLDSLKYEDGLAIRLIEGLRSDTPEDYKVGGVVIKGTYPVDVTSNSKRVTVKFEVPVAWQVVDESYTTWDEDEVRDGKDFLQVLSKSAYSDYVDANHGWFKDVAGPAEHYRLWTENVVIDVVAHQSPLITSD